MPDPLSVAFSALADPTRRAILARLAQGEATVNELADPFEISLPAISRHLKVLEGAGLISRGRRLCISFAAVNQVAGHGRYERRPSGAFLDPGGIRGRGLLVREPG